MEFYELRQKLNNIFLRLLGFIINLWNILSDYIEPISYILSKANAPKKLFGFCFKTLLRSMEEMILT